MESGIYPSFRRGDENVCYRVLIVDDNPFIHDDFRKILCPPPDADPRSDELESVIFGTPAKSDSGVTFQLDSAFQGQAAVGKLNEALAENRPYALAFVDIQMPPGWDGLETINRLWSIYPSLQIVICTAFSTYSWEDMRSLLKQPDSLLVIKKPFDNVEIQQMAHTLACKWELNLMAERGLKRLDESIRNLLPPSDEAIVPSCSEPDGQLPTHSDEHQIPSTLKRLSETLESTRSQLRHAEQQLVHSEKMASLGRLSAGILHEVNNPLNYAMAALAVLEMSAARLPADLREDHLDALRDIRDGCARILEITSSLRKFAHPEGGGLRPVQINEAVRTALNLMAAEIGDGITIENLIPDEAVIWGAGPNLTKVFVNLIHNSTHALLEKDHAPDDNPRILFIAEVVDGRTIVSVCDNGIGIPPAEIGKVFDPFYTTKDVGQGTGLGLGICHQILKEFGATLTVTSEVGNYTRFDMSFPDSE